MVLISVSILALSHHCTCVCFDDQSNAELLKEPAKGSMASTSPQKICRDKSLMQRSASEALPNKVGLLQHT